MADKQITHPIGLLPSWANDLNLTDPPEAWDGTPTKVEPGAGKRDAGYLPEENPTAQHVNQKFNELGRWIQYLSTVQPMNWINVGQAPSGSALQWFTSITYDEGIAAWVLGGGAGLHTLSRDSATFSATVASGTAQTADWSASKRPLDAPVHGGARSIFGTSADLASPNVSELSGLITAPAWTNAAVPHGTAQAHTSKGAWDRINSLWIVAGVEDTGGGANTVVFWNSVTPVVAFAKTTPPNVNSTDVVDMVHGEDGAGGALNVAIGNGTAPAIDVWTSTDGVTWGRSTPTGLNAGEDARALMWDPLRLVFVLTTQNHVYTSTDGIAYTNISSGTPLLGTFRFRVLTSDGGGVYIASQEGIVPVLRFSIDGGATWRFLNAPPSETLPWPVHAVAYSRYLKRFGMTVVDSPGAPAGKGNFAVSLAVGDTIFTPLGILTPTVT